MSEHRHHHAEDGAGELGRLPPPLAWALVEALCGDFDLEDFPLVAYAYRGGSQIQGYGLLDVRQRLFFAVTSAGAPRQLGQ